MHTSAPDTQGDPMPYPSGHRSAVKKNIIDSARMLFNRHGFDNVSIHQIMAGAGLTHGGFYSYFKTKSSVCRGIGVLLHRPGMEELLGRRGSGPVVRPIYHVSISRTSRIPARWSPCRL